MDAEEERERIRRLRRMVCDSVALKKQCDDLAREARRDALRDLEERKRAALPAPEGRRLSRMWHREMLLQSLAEEVGDRAMQMAHCARSQLAEMGGGK